MKGKADDAWIRKRAIAQKVRLAVLERDGYECRLRLPGCLGRATEVDHIVPRAAGGPVFDLDNLRAACRSCNTRRRTPWVRGAEAGPSREW